MTKILPADLEAYIFSVVVSPLKGYEPETFKTFNPLEHRGIELGIGKAMLDRSYRHNYQRNLARRDRTKYVCIRHTGNVYVVGEYIAKRREMKLFENEARKLGSTGMLVVGKLEEILRQSYSFKKVHFVPETHGIKNIETEWFGGTTIS